MNKTINNILKWVDKEQCCPNVNANLSFEIGYEIDDRIYYTLLYVNLEMASLEGSGYEVDYLPWSFDKFLDDSYKRDGWSWGDPEDGNVVDEDTEKKLDALLRKDMDKLLRDE